MKVDNYLKRINYEGELKRDAATLSGLQTAHLKAVPYENLDLYFRRDFTLAYGEIYDKIVNRHRGGYCFELNGIFAWL
ncbi:MAG: arylamine N-acetyltransferase [Victivallales bacterium]|nr:arylamine N-acetyltransferase [Victivallales bacterium]